MIAAKFRQSLLLLLIPNIAFARGTFVDLRGLFYLVLVIVFIAAVWYFVFIAPMGVINKANRKSSSDEHGAKVWISFLYSLFVPILVITIFGVNNIYVLLTALVLWLFAINHFFKKDKPQAASATINVRNELTTEPKESHYEWELTESGLVNLKTGHFVPKAYLRQMEEPEPGCLIDNFILHTEFIPENKIRLCKPGLDIAGDAGADMSNEMIQFNITYKNGMYLYKTFRYERLRDAIEYAKIDSQRS